MQPKTYLIRLALIVLPLLTITSAAQAADLKHASGDLSLLRVHERGSAYGPPTDRIDVEVVVCLKSLPNTSFGFQLRDDAELPARRAMFDLLRAAFEHGWEVHVDYLVDADKKNGVLHRVWVTR